VEDRVLGILPALVLKAVARPPAVLDESVAVPVAVAGPSNRGRA
jgi:hypothetical protein